MSDPCRSPIVRVPVPAASPAVRIPLPGPQGADGLDAYAVWLAAGHTGSRDDFLSSLRGRDGTGGGFVEMPAATALGGHRMVRATLDGAAYASSNDPTHALTVLGVTRSATAPGMPTSITRSGEIVEPSWSWSIGSVFLGLDGGLTQSPPTHGFELVVGFAPAPTRLLVALGEPITLAT